MQIVSVQFDNNHMVYDYLLPIKYKNTNNLNEICKGAIVETAYGTKVVSVVGFSNIKLNPRINYKEVKSLLMEIK